MNNTAMNGFLKKTGRTGVSLFRSIPSSAVSFALDFGILVLLTEVAGLHYLISNAVGFMAGTTLNYMLCILWVFSERRITRRHLEYWIFILIGASGVGLNELLIWTLTEHLHIYYLLSKIIAGCTVFSYNFSTRKFILFRQSKKEARA